VTVVAPLPTVAPGATGTGVPDGTALTTLTASNKPYPGDAFNADGNVFTINTPNAVYDGWRFDAFVDVRAPGVRLTRSMFRGGASTAVDRGLLYVVPETSAVGQPSALIEDATFIPRAPSYRIDGIRGSNFTARRIEIAGVVDGMHIHGTTTRSDPNAGNVLLEASWIHDLTYYSVVPGHTDGSHNDAVQIIGGRNITLRGNTLVGARNAAVMVRPGRNTIANVTITRNWAGNGACTLNLDNNPDTTMSGISITDNQIYRDSTYNCGIAINKAIPATIATNTWNGTTTPVSILWR
jgi:hypothetical protein